jgi:hypothetical protein
VSSGRLLVGLLLGALALTSVSVRLLPEWWGPPAWLADAVIGLAIVVVTSQLLGVVGGFRLVAMASGLVAGGAIAWFIGSRPTSRGPGAAEWREASRPLVEPWPARFGRGASFVAVAATAVVSAEWSTRTIEAYLRGPRGAATDTLWYHLPFAARFVQEGSITGAHYTDGDALAASFPANGALLHGIGMMFLGSDLLSPLINVGFLALALLAAWCVGRRFGVAPATLTCLAVVLGLPSLAFTQPGGGYNDIVGIALLIAAGALLLTPSSNDHDAPHPQVLVLAALAAGLAAGMKFQFLAPVVAFTIGVIVFAPRAQRVRSAVLWLVPLAMTGGLWYVRNLFLFDNPLPPFGIDLGPINLPTPPVDSPQSSLASFAFDDHVWRDHFSPGLSRALGPVWWAVVALAVAGLILGFVVAKNRMHRLVAGAGVVSLVAFVVTPLVHDVGGEPAFFFADLRYATLFLALGLVILPLGLAPARAWWSLVAAGLVLAVTQIDASIWPTDWRDLRLTEPVRGAAPIAALGVGVCVLAAGVAIVVARASRPRWWPSPRVVLPVGAGIAGLALLAVQHPYLDNRYLDTPPTPELYEWARDVREQRIGVAADLLFLQYPFYGNDLSNHVQYITQRQAHGAVRPIFRCADWRRALNAGRYSYVVTGSGLLSSPQATGKSQGPYALWTVTDPAARLIRREVSNVDESGRLRFGFVGYSLFRIDGPLDPKGCAALEVDQP